MIIKCCFLILAYLIGSFPTGVYYSKYIHKVDVRTLGSGNSGGTNIGRNFGLKAGITVIIIDALKGVIPVLIAKWCFPQDDWVIMGVGMCVVLGHAYPIWANFRGGKVLATSIGVMLAYNPWIALLTIGMFILLLYLFSMVSLAGMASYLLSAVIILIISPLTYGIGFILIALFLLYRHHENINRLLHGNENKINWGLGKDK